MKRLLCIILLVHLSLSAAAFQVELVVPVTECFEGETVLIEIQVFPANPAQTSLDIESVPRDFSLASSRKERRRIEDPSSFSSGLVDSVVFVQEWTTGEAGVRILGPFIVVVEGVEQVLAPVEIRVHARHDGSRGEIRWKLDRESQTIRRGTPVTLVLEGRYLFDVSTLDCPPPRNALLEQSDRPVTPDTATGSDWVPVAYFIWTPLSEGIHALPAARMVYHTLDGEEAVAGISRTTVTVLPADPVSHEETEPPLLAAAFTGSAADESFRDTAFRDVPLPQSLTASTDPVLEAAAHAWRSGHYGEALAALRRGEYVSFFPGRYRAIRQDAELALGFTGYPPPPSKPVLRCVLGFLVVSLFIFLFIFPLRKKSRALFVCLAINIFVMLISVLAAVILFPSAFHPEAVSTGAELRQIPEDNAGVVTTIPAGTPVTVRNKTGSWCYVQLPASGEGWVSGTQIIPYTSAGLYGFW